MRLRSFLSISLFLRLRQPGAEFALMRCGANSLFGSFSLAYYPARRALTKTS